MILKTLTLQQGQVAEGDKIDKVSPCLMRGFTLIELLVVVTIISLLSSMLMIGIFHYRDKAQDSRITADLNQIRVLATIIANTQSYSYLCNGGNLNTNPSFIGYGKKLKIIEDDIKKLNSDNQPICYSTDTVYCVQASGKAADNLCLDSTGYIGEIANCSNLNIKCAP